jgi:hypothetical protein
MLINTEFRIPSRTRFPQSGVHPITENVFYLEFSLEDCCDTVSSCEFYFLRSHRIPTVFLQGQELYNIIKTCSDSDTLFSTPSLNLRLETSSTKPHRYVLYSTSMEYLKFHTNTITPPTHKLCHPLPLFQISRFPVPPSV